MGWRRRGLRARREVCGSGMPAMFCPVTLHAVLTGRAVFAAAYPPRRRLHEAVSSWGEASGEDDMPRTRRRMNGPDRRNMI